MMIVIDRNDNTLQRLGGQVPQSGYIGIPSIMVMNDFGRCIDQYALNERKIYQDMDVILEYGQGPEISDAWNQLAFTQWSKDIFELKNQLNELLEKKFIAIDSSITAWIERKLHRVDDLMALASGMKQDEVQQRVDYIMRSSDVNIHKGDGITHMTTESHDIEEEL